MVAPLKFKDEQEASSYRSFITQRFSKIAGVDDVGGGCLCGPVVVACVYLPPGHSVEGIKDCKKFSSPGKMYSVYENILEESIWSLGIVQAEEVDKLNVHNANLAAAQQAVEKILDKMPGLDFLACDSGIEVSVPSSVEVVSIVKGETHFEQIAAASIVAKSYRDSVMEIYDEFWPEYGFASNKGYGTKQHMEAIEKYGITSEHRRTFGPCRNAKLRDTDFWSS